MRCVLPPHVDAGAHDGALPTLVKEGTKARNDNKNYSTAATAVASGARAVVVVVVCVGRWGAMRLLGGWPQRQTTLTKATKIQATSRLQYHCDMSTSPRH